MSSLKIINADVVLPDGISRGGCVLVEGDAISAVDPVSAAADDVIDLEGALLIPGVIDLHGDAVEQAVQARPGVFLPWDFGVHRVDLRCASAGVTTAYHALSFAGREHGLRNMDNVARMVDAIAGAPQSLVEHRVHCRYEIGYPAGADEVESLIGRGVCRLLSLMDHTPGQGQFHSIDGAIEYYQRTYHLKRDEAEAVLAERLPPSDARVAERMLSLARHAVAHGVPVASHDDDTPGRVRLVAEAGATISEFPMAFEAAEVARDLGMHGIMGAPNAYRGGSHGKGPRAAEMISRGLATSLCSDYAPETMIPAALRLAEELGWPIHRAFALITSGPADAAGLSDRGRIAPGLRADLAAVVPGALPRVPVVVKNGRVALSCRPGVQHPGRAQHDGRADARAPRIGAGRPVAAEVRSAGI